MRITFNFQVYLKCLENSQMRVPLGWGCAGLEKGSFHTARAASGCVICLASELHMIYIIQIFKRLSLLICYYEVILKNILQTETLYTI